MISSEAISSSLVSHSFLQSLLSVHANMTCLELRFECLVCIVGFSLVQFSAGNQ